MKDRGPIKLSRRNRTVNKFREPIHSTGMIDSTSGRPRSLLSWLRLPLWLGCATTLLVVLLLLADVKGARDDRNTFDNGYHSTATIDTSWDGGRRIPLIYRNPRSGENIESSTYLWNDQLRPRGPGTVAIDIARNNPKDVRIAGDRFPAGANWPEYLPWWVLPFIVWRARIRTLRRSEELIESSTTTFRMTGLVSGPRGIERRWKLRLFALDSADMSNPICTVPLVGRPPDGRLNLEVKGDPRPGGRVVARTLAGEILWPAGRALRK